MERWNNPVWGIVLHAYPPDLLLTTLWLRPMPGSLYVGEPLRALVFTTRAAARECVKSIKKNRPKHWRFRVVKLRERYINGQ